MNSFKEAEFGAIAAMLVLAAVQAFQPEMVSAAAPFLLMAGMIFPGIPHGAVDNLLLTGEQGLAGLSRFLARYLLIMALMLLLWFISPVIWLAVFLLVSGWHFGETDARRFKSFGPVSAFIRGMCMLSFILTSHPQEFRWYLDLFGIGSGGITDRDLYLIAGVCFMAYFSAGLSLIRYKGGLFVYQAGTVLLTAYLPLLLAFGVYFIFIHSISAWRDLKDGLRLSSITLIRKSLPFSLLAFVFIGAFIWFYRVSGSPQAYLASFFIALSAISTPHIFYMSGFYHRNSGE